MRKTFGQLIRNSGQATIEYILLLVVVVALVVGPLKQFSQMFNGYMEAIFGRDQYLACLLETGELGGQSTDAGSSCSATLKASVQAALAASQNAGANGSGSGNGAGANSGNGSNSNSQDGSDSASANNKTPTTSNASQGSGSSDGSGGGASGSENSAFNNVGVAAGANQRNRPPSRQIVKGGGAAGKEGFEDSYVKTEGGDYDYKSLKAKSGFEIPIGKMDRRFEEADPEAVRAEKLAPKEVASTNTKNLRAKEVSMDPPRAPAAKDEDINADGFGFSMLLKWFLIAAILIALIVVVGGQALQVSKGGDN